MIRICTSRRDAKPNISTSLLPERRFPCSSAQPSEKQPGAAAPAEARARKSIPARCHGRLVAGARRAATAWAGCWRAWSISTLPLEIAQYAEGQRFVAFFVLDQVQDSGKDGSGKSVPQYLCAITEPHDGAPYDYDQVRVFTWNTRKHRYETAYREHGLNGVLAGYGDHGELRQGRHAAGFYSASEGRRRKRDRAESTR